MNTAPKVVSGTHYAVAIDADKCSFCEVCSRDCPTEALRSERDGGMLRIYFEASLCTGCPEHQSCEQLCPEHAIALTTAADGPDQGSEKVLLAQSDMVHCAYCGEEFAPLRKLDAIAGKEIGHEVVRDYCPLCRRTELVVRFIKDKRDPHGQPEYRAAHDILRRAGYDRPRKKRGY